MYKTFLIVNVAFLATLSCKGQQSWPWEPNPGTQATVLLFGDTNIQGRTDPAEPFGSVLKTLEKADLRICNLEGAFAGSSTDPRVPDIPHKESWRHSEPQMVQGLTKAGIDIVGVANNVTYPWQALLRSLEVLDRNKIHHAGGGLNLEDAHKPVVIERNGVRFGFLSYACTVFPYQHAATRDVPGIASVRVDTYYKPVRNLDKPGMPMITVTIPDAEELARMVNDVHELRKKADIIIVSYHWGVSDRDELIDYQVTIAHSAVEAGADVVMGHGNHMVAAVEMFRDKPIFYGLGNFVFDWSKMRDRHKDGLAVKLDIKGKMIDRVSFVPLRRDENNNPEFLNPNTGVGAEIILRVKSLTRDLSVLTLGSNEVIVTPNHLQGSSEMIREGRQ